MSLLSSDTFAKIGDTKMTYQEFINDLANKYNESYVFTKVNCNPELPSLTDEYINKRKYKASWCSQFGILCSRAIRNSSKQFKNEFMRAVTVTIHSLFMIVLYYDVIYYYRLV